MDNTQPLRIVNGQFMRGNNIIEPEIGNREQIECLQAYEKAAQKRPRKPKQRVLNANFMRQILNIHLTSN